jgi:predicted ArsR family transcriptional regulator
LLVPSFERRTGRTGPGSGRPAKTYRVAPEFAAIQFPERHYERLIGLVADALPQRARLDRLHQIGLAFGRELARQAGVGPAKALRPALERVCSALGRLGYQATLAEVNDDGALITTPTCPLRPLVRAQPQLAELDRGMWAGLLATAFERANAAAIVCETADSCRTDRPDCRVRLNLETRRAARA